MNNPTVFDTIIIGGSFAGLSAAMALGRSLRKVLIIDAGEPCNKQVQHSHNLLSRDGEPPAEIAAKAREQVLNYPSIKIIQAKAASAKKIGNGFEINTTTGEVFKARKILLATGVVDIMPDIPGFAECWGNSIAHCPYCHGYEVHHTKLGVIGNGDLGFDFAKLINNLTDDLTLFTNGKSTLTENQTEKLEAHHINIAEAEIQSIEHENAQIKNLVLKDGSKFALTTLFARVPFKLSSNIAQNLGCEITEMGLIKVDDFQKTTVPGAFAAGDNSSPMRSLAKAIASGNFAGAFINHELINEDF